VGGNILEEDGVDHRVESSMWLTDGTAEGAPGDPQAASAASQPDAAAEDASQLPEMPPMPGSPFGVGEPEAAYGEAEGPYTGQQETAYGAGGQSAPYPPADQISYGSPSADTVANGDAPGMAHTPQVPPLPAQVPPAPGRSLPSMPGMAAKVTAPFAALTKPKIKAKKPVRPAQPKTRPGVRVTQGTRPAPKGSPATAPTRRAQLVLSRIEPWSVMKFSFMISLVGWVVLFVAVAALYYVLSKLGVFHSIQSTISDVTSSKGSAGTDANGQWFSASRILGYTMLVGAINVVLITALATVGAVIYNLVTHLAGGIEVTLKETD
jgi:Transmembrane domain of unknown function (DUF3566)